VLPEYQNKGVGKALLRRTIEEATRLGYSAIVFFGEPDYYPRLGFKRAAEFGILTAWGGELDAFMAMPLFEGAFDGLAGGVFHEDPVYSVNAEEAAEFEMKFPDKTEHILLPIEILPVIISKELRETFTEKKITLLDDLHRFSGREIAAFPGMRSEWFAAIDECLVKNGLLAKTWPK
jgi:Predicted acetyltransferase